MLVAIARHLCSISALLTVALGAPLAVSASAQTASPNNYRSYARCTEVEVNGRIYSTFGEGRCPPGSTTRGYVPKSSSDVNALNQQSTRSAVDALSRAQGSVLALGQAITARQQARSQDIANSLYIEVLDDEMVGDKPLYVNQAVTILNQSNLKISKPGDILVQSAIGFYSDCIIPMVEHTGSQIGGWKFKAVAGEPACKLMPKDTGYMPTYYNSGRSKDRFDFIYALSTKAENKGHSLCFRNMGVNFSCRKELTDSDLLFVKGFVANTESLSDVLILSGIDGDKAEFSFLAGPVNSGRQAVSKHTVVLRKGVETDIGPYHIEIVDWSAVSLVTKAARVR